MVSPKPEGSKTNKEHFEFEEEPSSRVFPFFDVVADIS